MLPPPYNTPSMVVSPWAPGDPLTDLTGVTAPKVLILGDLHHGPQPLQTALQRALAYPWDLIIVQYTKQHVRWFQEAGLQNVVHIPCFGIAPISPLCGGYPDNVIPLENRKHGVPVQGFSTQTREQAAKIHAESTVCLNISLNGDFNLRNFEVMAAGGILITERLHTDSGQDDILDDGTNCRLWSNVDELAKLCKYYLRYPRKARDIAQEGFSTYWAEHTPEKKIAELHKSIASVSEARRLFPKIFTQPTPPAGLFERVALYEHCQRLAQQNKLGSALDDLKDLRRS